MNPIRKRLNLQTLSGVDLVFLALVLAAVLLYAGEPSRIAMLAGSYQWFRALLFG